MRNTIYYIVGGSLASISIPALAQDAPMQDASPEVVAESSATPERQSLFWRISDANKVTLAGLSAEQQAQVWTQIEGQAAAQAATAGTETD